MKSEFVDYLSSMARTARRDLVEKDVILHEVLIELAEDTWFSENFVFKGGTCLTKQYLGYYRFSEDLDFTWYLQSKLMLNSSKKLRKALSEIIDRIGSLFENIATRLGFDFRTSKDDRDYVELGGSNKFCTFKIWYNSIVLKRRTFFKVQFNFVEELCFERIQGQLKSLVAEKSSGEMEKLFEEYVEYAKPISLWVYDIREILSEKLRAILTRRGDKMRDYIDIFFIEKTLDLSPRSVENCALRKLRTTLTLYEKYRNNLAGRIATFDLRTPPDLGREQEMMLVDVDASDFLDYSKYLLGYIKSLAEKLEGD